MPEVLYKSAAIKKKLNELFEAPDKSDRRVALVAYIGQDYADYLPGPRGIDVVCNPTPGATSVIAVDGLRKAGALVRFSDKLHMKVYWSKARGCVITSANLSKNAFGVRGLKEAGVWLEPNSVDIDKLVKEAQPYAVTNSRIERLRVDENRYERALAQIRPREADSGFQYLDWYQLSPAARTPWKLGDYNGDDGIADAAKDRLNSEFNMDDAANWHGVSNTISLRRRRLVVLARAVAQQRNGAGGLADGGGLGGFVRHGLPDFLLYEVQEVEEEGGAFGTTGHCHYILLRHLRLLMPEV
jgi:hypothetical protein